MSCEGIPIYPEMQIDLYTDGAITMTKDDDGKVVFSATALKKMGIAAVTMLNGQKAKAVVFVRKDLIADAAQDGIEAADLARPLLRQAFEEMA